ncbi:MAG: translation elongation factor Ts [Candidatus Omnitrophica bacterium]|nr:translation elongation factor Ts [Candidatus Omnitrophota bacterium]
MKIDAEKIKNLREKTGLSIMECKKAIEEADGDFEKALEILKKRGIEISEKKTNKEAREGLIGCYVHTNGKVGVLIEVNCESDFVARNSEFKELVKNLCLQIAAMKPKWIDINSIPEDILNKKKDEIKEQFKDKPESVINKIIEGKLQDFYKENVLLKQQFIKDEGMTIEEYIKSKIAKLGENIKVKKFVRFEIGE